MRCEDKKSKTGSMNTGIVQKKKKTQNRLYLSQLIQVVYHPNRLLSSNLSHGNLTQEQIKKKKKAFPIQNLRSSINLTSLQGQIMAV